MELWINYLRLEKQSEGGSMNDVGVTESPEINHVRGGDVICEQNRLYARRCDLWDKNKIFG